MGGIGLILNIAKEALMSQQYAMDVVGHNVANVNTPGYTRQTPTLQNQQAAPYSGMLFGRGVELVDIVRNTDAFIENMLQKKETDLMGMSEKEIYLSSMELIFNENSGRSLSSQLAEYWNAWQDVSNNPSGLSERSILLETGELLAESFRDAYHDLDTLSNEINKGIDAGVTRVNELLGQIADINEKIVAIEVNGTASDLRDQRNMLVRELGEYMDISSYEHEEGSLTVTTARGYILVSRADHYSLTFDGHDIEWEGSGNNMVAITDTILGGKMGGWLDMRDEIIPKHQADLSELAKTLAWEVNEIHSQGVGTSGFASLTSTYTAADSTEEIGTIESGLDFHDRITDGAFTLWLYDDTGAVVGSTSVPIVATGTTLDGLAATLDGLVVGGENALSSTVVNGKLQIQVDSTAGYGSYSFAFSDDTSHVLAALGINTFFTGSDANTIGVNDIFSTDQRLIAAGKVDATGAMAAGNNTNALDLADLQYKGVTIRKWTYERGSLPTYLDMPNTTLENYLHDFVGSIGIQSQSATREREYNEVIIDQLKMTRENISGVSIDEEMTNLIKFQQAYAAAAKLVTTADEMLKVILETK